jgi:hypothetical protein
MIFVATNVIWCTGFDAGFSWIDLPVFDKEANQSRTARLMVFKLVSAAAKTWRRLKGENQLPKVVRGVKIPQR